MQCAMIRDFNFMVNAISFPSHKSCLRWGSNTHLSYFPRAPDPGSEPYLQPPRAWALLARNVTHRFRIVYRPCVNWSPCRASGPGLGLGLLPGRFLCAVVSEPHAKPLTRASTEPKANLWLGKSLPSFLPLASCCIIPVARTIAPTHLQLQSPQNYERAGAFHILFDVSLFCLSFKPCVTSYGAELRKIESISAFVPWRKSTVQIFTYTKFNCISLFSLCLKLCFPCHGVELRIRQYLYKCVKRSR